MAANPTHYSIVDKDDTIVAATHAINLLFGNRQIAGQTGVFPNGEMDDFISRSGAPHAADLVQSLVNKVEHGRRLEFDDANAGAAQEKLSIATDCPETPPSYRHTGKHPQHDRLLNEHATSRRYAGHGLLRRKARQILEAVSYTVKVPSGGGDEATLLDSGTGLLKGANDPRRAADY